MSVKDATVASSPDDLPEEMDLPTLAAASTASLGTSLKKDGTKKARAFARMSGIGKADFKMICKLTEWKISNYTEGVVAPLPAELAEIQAKLEPPKLDTHKSWTRLEILHLGLCAELKMFGQSERTAFLLHSKSRSRQSLKESAKLKISKYAEAQEEEAKGLRGDGIWCPGKGGYKY